MGRGPIRAKPLDPSFIQAIKIEVQPLLKLRAKMGQLDGSTHIPKHNLFSLVLAGNQTLPKGLVVVLVIEIIKYFVTVDSAFLAIMCFPLKKARLVFILKNHF